MLTIPGRGPTIFPIIYAGVVARSLRSLAAWRLERSASVLALEYLLGSRTVLSAITTPLELRAFSVAPLLLIPLWALSPLGGQAALRVVSAVPAAQNTSIPISALSFFSPFTHEGPGSASSPGLLEAINSAFTSALISPPSSKHSGQDAFGNIKIPMLEAVPGYRGGNSSTWLNLKDDPVYSAITGLRTQTIPSSGTTSFNMETGYMYADCRVSHKIANRSAAYAAGNFGIAPFSGSYLLRENSNTTTSHPSSVVFSSFSYGEDHTGNLTVANCTLTTTYVEVSIKCEGAQQCGSTAIRSSQLPHNGSECPETAPPALSAPVTSYYNVSYNATDLTVLDGMCNSDTNYMNYFVSFENSSNSADFCDTGNCMASPMESYLLDPDQPFSVDNPYGSYGGFVLTTPPIWPIGDKAFSQRFTQLLNTYWINSIAPFVVTGNLTVSNFTGYLDSQNTFDVRNFTAQNETQLTALRCHRSWLTVLLIAALVMLLTGLAGAVFGALRRGPDILGRFSPLLRDHPYANGMEGPSMEDAVEQARRLRHLQVTLGDVKPGADVGHVAIAAAVGDQPISRLDKSRLYD